MTSLFQAVGECRVDMAAGPDAVPGVAPGTAPGAVPGAFAAAFVFPSEFLGFAGHFPGRPVLPGIAQIMAVVHACGDGAPPVLRGIKTCKFLRPVIPGERVAIQGVKKSEGPAATVTAAMAVDGVPCASMTLSVAQSAALPMALSMALSMDGPGDEGAEP